MELYKISFPKNLSKKEYIGISSVSAEHRLKQHLSSSKKYPISLAIKKYGRENVILEVIGSFSSFDDLYRAEQQAILLYGTKSPNGYNLTDGGKGAYGLPASDERKRKISAANKGRKASLETRKKISDANVGRDFTIQVEAMRQANKGRKLSKDRIERMRKNWIGRKHTEESKRKMSESASKRKASMETRSKMSASIKIARGDKTFTFLSPNGEVFAVKDMKGFCTEHGLTSVHMYRVSAGSAGSHKGWVKFTN